MPKQAIDPDADTSMLWADAACRNKESDSRSHETHAAKSEAASLLRIPYRQSAHGHHEAHITAHDDTTDIGHRCIDPHSCLRHKSRKALKYAAVRALPLHKATVLKKPASFLPVNLFQSVTAAHSHNTDF